ncbi:MAG: tRNA epoxyqueuosine(34) reductase QueG [Acidobacteriota bacterium]|nr:tRNA epoxyqueuosine(34) reductase QueG [Acidobacteriota bacterium]
MTSDRVRELARECGFELAGVAAAEQSTDFERFRNWADRGMAGEMKYLTDHRADIRSNPKLLLETARSVICVGKLYNGPQAYSTAFKDAELGWISRYAWGGDYHAVLRSGLTTLAERLGPNHDYRVCVDTAPLLERSYARAAGLGWIAKNTCLINEPLGSWFFLGELLTSLEIQHDSPPPDRCGTCRRCIDACPTDAISTDGYELDARLCISYFTIELRGPVPEQHRSAVGAHVFGCDICQDVCPWNRRAPVTQEAAFSPTHSTPPLERLAELSEVEFRNMFRDSAVSRAKYRGMLRNVAIAMGNAGLASFQAPLKKLALSDDPLVREHARWALARCRHVNDEHMAAPALR